MQLNQIFAALAIVYVNICKAYLFHDVGGPVKTNIFFDLSSVPSSFGYTFLWMHLLLMLQQVTSGNTSKKVHNNYKLTLMVITTTAKCNISLYWSADIGLYNVVCVCFYSGSSAAASAARVEHDDGTTILSVCMLDLLDLLYIVCVNTV